MHNHVSHFYNHLKWLLKETLIDSAVLRKEHCLIRTVNFLEREIMLAPSYPLNAINKTRENKLQCIMKLGEVKEQENPQRFHWECARVHMCKCMCVRVLLNYLIA